MSNQLPELSIENRMPHGTTNSIDGLVLNEHGNPVIGPGSILWEQAGRRWNLATAVPGGIVQLMHPKISAGVIEHSDFFENPLGRVLRSINPILGTIYDPDPHSTGEWVRDRHRGIKGALKAADGEEQPYYALAEDPFHFAHMSFVVMVEEGIDRFSRPLTPDQREELYQGSKIWYSRYGVSMKPVPPDRQAFQKEWDHYLTDVLEMTEAARITIEKAEARDIGRPPNVSAKVWKVAHKAVSERVRLFAIGGLPEMLRERFDIPFSAADQRRLERYEAFIRSASPLLPVQVNYFKRARQGMLAAEQQAATAAA